MQYLQLQCQTLTMLMVVRTETMNIYQVVGKIQTTCHPCPCSSALNRRQKLIRIPCSVTACMDKIITNVWFDNYARFTTDHRQEARGGGTDFSIQQIGSLLKLFQPGYGKIQETITTVYGNQMRILSFTACFASLFSYSKISFLCIPQIRIMNLLIPPSPYCMSELKITRPIIPSSIRMAGA